MARKRAPGGGRKPSPHTPRAQLTIRMQDSMRAQLEASAKKRGLTVTEELLWRLRVSFAMEQEERRDPAAWALCFLISQIAALAYAHLPGVPWHRNPFMFRAFKLGVIRLLGALEPQGEAESPFANLGSSDQLVPDRLLAEIYKTPESAADFAAASVLRGLFHPSPPTQDQRASLTAAAEMNWPGRGKQMVDAIDEDFNSMAHARQALGIGKSKKGS
jgi:hypothetical protein